MDQNQNKAFSWQAGRAMAGKENVEGNSP